MTDRRFGCKVPQVKPTAKARWHFYVVRCVDDSLFAGVTQDADSDLRQQNAGRGPSYTRLKRPVHLALLEAYASRRAATRRVAQFNRLPKHQKEWLVCGESDPAVWRALQLGEPWLDPRQPADESPAQLSPGERDRV